MGRGFNTVLLSVVACATACGGSFGFETTFQAGNDNRGPGQGWEFGVSAPGITPSTASRIQISGTPNYYLDNVPQWFEIGYRAASNIAYARFYPIVGSFTTYLEATYAPTITGATNGNSVSMPASGFSAQALRTNQTTQINVDNMSISTALGVISPASLSAIQTGVADVIRTEPANISFTPQSATGSWSMRGQIYFQGLTQYVGGSGARGAELQLVITVNQTTPAAVPEPGTLGWTGAAITGIVWLGVRRNRAPPVERGSPRLPIYALK